MLTGRKRFNDTVEAYLAAAYSPTFGGTFLPEWWQKWLLKTEAMWARRERKASRRHQRQKRKQ